MKKIYAGVGSRECPEDVGLVMTDIATYLEQKDYLLRSGGANGSDLFFERGVIIKENKHIFIPNKGFNDSNSDLFGVTQEALEMAASIHPAWERCKPFARQLHARNCYQILGKDLRTPADFVLCWTQDGKVVGGTATAIRLAKRHDIPVFNFGNVKSGQYRLAFDNFFSFQE